MVQHDDILLDLEPYLGVRGALPVLLLLLLGLGHHRQRYVSDTLVDMSRGGDY